MIGQHQTIGRNEGRRTAAGADGSTHHMIDPRLVGIEIVSGFKLLTRQIVKRPHAFVREDLGVDKQSCNETDRALKIIHWNLSGGMRANGVRQFGKRWKHILTAHIVPTHITVNASHTFSSAAVR